MSTSEKVQRYPLTRYVAIDRRAEVDLDPESATVIRRNINKLPAVFTRYQDSTRICAKYFYRQHAVET